MSTYIGKMLDRLNVYRTIKRELINCENCEDIIVAAFSKAVEDSMPYITQRMLRIINDEEAKTRIELFEKVVEDINKLQNGGK